MRVLVLGVCLWMSAAVCSAQTPFDGQFNGLAGNENLTFTFTTDEGKVTGMVSLEGGDDTAVRSTKIRATRNRWSGGMWTSTGSSRSISTTVRTRC